MMSWYASTIQASNYIGVKHDKYLGSLIQCSMLYLCKEVFPHLFHQALDISEVRFCHLKPGKRGQQVIGEGSDHRGALG